MNKILNPKVLAGTKKTAKNSLAFVGKGKK